MKQFAILGAVLLIAGCARLDHVGRPPTMTDVDENNAEHSAMLSPGLPLVAEPSSGPTGQASLWTSSQRSLLGDRRAEKRGDILTVVVEIDDKAEISNSTERARKNSEELKAPALFGFPQRIQNELPEGASLADAVDVTSKSASEGDGSVRRKEKLTLRIAATVTNVMPNGVLIIEGRQEVRVNFELRELLVEGLVRPEDISRGNEITYDKIASARISYGGRGQITDVQQPRIGQQLTDVLLPF